MPNLTHPVDGTEIINEAMQNTGLSQAQVAKLLDVRPSTVFRWRNGSSMRLWHRDLLERATLMPQSRRGDLYILMQDGRHIDALALILGAPMVRLQKAAA